MKEINNVKIRSFRVKRQHTVTFFQSALTNQVAVVQKGVLYLNPQASGVTFVVDEVGSKLVVTYTETGGVPTKFTFNKRDVNWIASFGSAGDDTYVNNTSKKVVQYGAGGNDQIIGENQWLHPGIAQLVERVFWEHEVAGSSPVSRI